MEFFRRSDGGFPFADLIMDRPGNRYGTTAAGGLAYRVVVEPRRPRADRHSGAKACYGPFRAALTATTQRRGFLWDRYGNLYGTTAFGGSGCGVVFEPTPPVRGGTRWREQVLWSFTCGLDGRSP